MKKLLTVLVICLNNIPQLVSRSSIQAILPTNTQQSTQKQSEPGLINNVTYNQSHINTNQSYFNKKMSILGRNLSSISYCQTNVIENWSCGYLCDETPIVGAKVISDELTKTQAIVVVQDSLLSVVFRGSAYLQNWLTDFEISQVPYSDQYNQTVGYVHSGFQKVSNKLKDRIIEEIRKYGIKDILVTGHSLGGSIAVLMALELNKLRLSEPALNIYLYTYGQPRVGDESFVNYTNLQLNNYFRIVNNRDIVPHLPAQFQKYSHAGIEVWIQPDIEYIFNSVQSIFMLQNYNTFQQTFDIIQQTQCREQICGLNSNNCSNSLYWYSISDHLVYYNELISQYCNLHSVIAGLLSISNRQLIQNDVKKSVVK